MDYIKKLPVAVCGVALGFAALGNLLQSYAEGIRLVCGIISVLLLLAYIVKLCVMPQEVRQELSDPISLSVAATFPMAVMLLSVYGYMFYGNCSTYSMYRYIFILLY